MVVKEISAAEFEEFTRNFVLESVYQTVEYSKVLKDQKFDILFIGASSNGSTVAASMIYIQKYKNFNYAYAPRGILMDYNNKPLVEIITKELKKFLNQKDVVALKLAPLIVRNVINREGKIIATNPDFDSMFAHLQSLGYYHLGFNAFFEALKPRFDAIIDLSVGYQVLFKNIKKEYKTKIRTAGRRGIKIFKAEKEDLPFLYEQVKDKYPRNIKYFEDSYKYFEDKMDFYYAKLDAGAYLKELQKEHSIQEQIVKDLNEMILNNKDSNSSKLIARKMEADEQFNNLKIKLIEGTNIISKNPDGVILASVLVVKNRNEIFLYMDGYDKKYKTFSAKHLLIWKVMEKYSNLGYRLFNMGGIADIRLNNKKYSGLNSFKTNFNPSIIEYAGDFELVVNGAKYFLYKQTKKLSK